MQRTAIRRTLLQCSSHTRHQYSYQTIAAANDIHVQPKLPAFDYTPPPYTGPTTADIMKKRKQFLSPSMFYFYSKPVSNSSQSCVACLSIHSIHCCNKCDHILTQVNVVHGKMQYLFDENGRRYLDAFGGIATVCCGHCHPDVVKAIVKQTENLQHSTILYLNHVIADFAEALASKLPGDLKVSLSLLLFLIACQLTYLGFDLHRLFSSRILGQKRMN